MMISRLLLITLICLGLAPVPAVAQSSAASPGKGGTKVQQFRDWNVRCDAKAPKKQCEMTQLVNQEKSKKPIMRVVVGYPPQGDKPIAIFLLPLGMRLPPGVKLSVDSDSPRSFPVQICVKQGCRADLPLKASLLKKLRAGTHAAVTIEDPRGGQDNLKISLLGFSAALKRISP